MNVGIAGTGRMGAAIATRLLAQGHTVTVWNRTPAKLAPLVAAGAKAADTPAALAAASETVITILTDAAAIDATYVALWDAGTRAALAAGASLSHHHGVGLNRARFVKDALGSGYGVLAASAILKWENASATANCKTPCKTSSERMT